MCGMQQQVQLADMYYTVDSSMLGYLQFDNNSGPPLP